MPATPHTCAISFLVVSVVHACWCVSQSVVMRVSVGGRFLQLFLQLTQAPFQQFRTLWVVDA